MFSNAKYYIESFRLRTLPLSTSGIILGSFLATANGFWRPGIFIWSLLTALSLQILSNISNELGDLQKGTDNENRLGPIRSVQSGKLTKQNLVNAMIVFIVLSAVFGLFLVASAFHSLISLPSIIMLIIGDLAILASIKYTFGKGAYGYVGLGDLGVFMFFGLVSVCGVYFLATATLPHAILLPAAAIGFLSTAVLNLNNMRDIENDKQFSKKTMVVRMGLKTAKIYHFTLIVSAFVFVFIYCWLQKKNGWSYLFLVSLPLFIFHLNFILKNKGKSLDKQMKVLAISTLLFSVLTGIGMLISR